MRDFIFDQYGYYYSDSDASEFEFKGYGTFFNGKWLNKYGRIYPIFIFQIKY